MCVCMCEKERKKERKKDTQREIHVYIFLQKAVNFQYISTKKNHVVK